MTGAATPKGSGGVRALPAALQDWQTARLARPRKWLAVLVVQQHAERGALVPEATAAKWICPPSPDSNGVSCRPPVQGIATED